MLIYFGGEITSKDFGFYAKGILILFYLQTRVEMHFYLVYIRAIDTHWAVRASLRCFLAKVH